MASGPITSWQIDGGKVETWEILYFWTPKSLWTLTAVIILKNACSLDGKP